VTREWRIPSRNSHLDLMMKTGEFIRDTDNDKNLFIVYYGGHGRINNERQAEWLCRRDQNSAKVHWSAIQTLFAEAESDVLILLDACAAASATARSLHGSMEAIVACGFESRAPPPGEHSFTNTLIDVLHDWVDRRSFSASCLHAEILSQLKLKENKRGREGKKLEWCVTPIYINCTQDSKAPSVELCRRNVLTLSPSSPREPRSTSFIDAMDLDLEDPLSSPQSLFSLAPSGQFRVPHVLISVALEESQPDLDVKKTARWLESIPVLAKWAKVEAVFQSYSTLLVMSVPVPIWNMLPDHPACSFVGYVTSPNLVTQPPPSKEAEQVGVPADDQDTRVTIDAEGNFNFRVPRFHQTNPQPIQNFWDPGNQRPFPIERPMTTKHNNAATEYGPNGPTPRTSTSSLPYPSKTFDLGSYDIKTAFPPPPPGPPPVGLRERHRRFIDDRQYSKDTGEEIMFPGGFNSPRDLERWERYQERIHAERASVSMGPRDVKVAPLEKWYEEKARDPEYDAYGRRIDNYVYGRRQHDDLWK
jgi:hypothetical protein